MSLIHLEGYIVIVTILCYALYIWKYRKTFFPPNDIPGPLNLPLIGYCYKLCTLKSDGKFHLFNLLCTSIQKIGLLFPKLFYSRGVISLILHVFWS